MKKLLRRILCFGLIIMLLPVGSLPVQAETASQEENYSVVDTSAESINTALDAFEYLLNETDKTVTLTRYIGTDSQVAILGPYVIDGVSYQPVLGSTTLFKGNTTITSVTIGECVGYMDNSMSYLFGECSKLVEIDLSAVDTSSVTDMSYLFYKCSALTTIDVAGLDTENVTTMRGMFSYCTKLSSLSGYEDWDTSSLEVMYHMFNRVASSVESIECIDLSNWDLDQVTNTGWCFQLCYAKQIILPDNLSVMSAGFLNHAAKVTGTSYTIPAGVKKIGHAHTIYDFATDDFTEFIVAEGNTDYKAIDGILYSADGTEMLAVPRNKAFPDGIYEIPEGVTFLGELSFSRNYNIHTLVLPDSYEIRYVPVYDPEYIVFEDVGNLNAGTNLSIAIYCYTGITEYQVKESNSRYASKDGIIYSKDMTEVVAVPARYAQEIVIPDGVTTWNKEAMWADFENNSQNTLANLLVNCPGVSIPSTLRNISDDQIEMLNLLYTKRAGTDNPFTITIAEGNKSFTLDENGNLCRTDVDIYYTSDKEHTITVDSDGVILFDDAYVLTSNGTKLTGKIGSDNKSVTFYQLNENCYILSSAVTYSQDGTTVYLYEYTGFCLDSISAPDTTGIFEVWDADEKEAAYSTLQDAVVAASDGDIIKVTSDYVVSEGTYIDKDITIDGGGHIVDKSEYSYAYIAVDANADVQIKNIVIDGGADGFEVDYEGVSYTNYTIPLKEESIDNDPQAILSPIISNGALTCDNIKILNSYTASYGGAISIVCGEATLKNSDFTHNYGKTYGGAIYIGTKFYDRAEYPIKSVIIENCTFDKNYSGHGGAIYAVNADSLSIETADFTNNTANGGKGGAIDLATENTTKPAGEVLGLDFMQTDVAGCTFKNNWAGNDGFAIQTYDSDLYVSDSDFIKNVGVHPTSSVGTVSIESYRSSAYRIYTSLKNCLFKENIGPCAAYGDHSSIADLDIEGCTFTGNQGNDSLLLYSSVANIKSTIFTEEKVVYGVIDARIYENWDVPPLLTLTDVSFEGTIGATDILTRKQNHNQELNTYNIILEGTTTADIDIWDNNKVTIMGNHTGNVGIDGYGTEENLVLADNAQLVGTTSVHPDTYTTILLYPYDDGFTTAKFMYLTKDRQYTVSECREMAFEEKEVDCLEIYEDSEYTTPWDFVADGELKLYGNWKEHQWNGINCTLCGIEHPNVENYEGKVISILGDSISTFAGYIPVADGFNLEHLARYPQDNLLTDVNDTWWMQVITELEAKLGINDSWRGSTVSGYPSVTTGVAGYLAAMSNLTQIQNLGSNGKPDVILFYGGTNDLAHTPNLGSFDVASAPSEVDLTTQKWDNLADAYANTLLRLKHFYPDTQIVCLLPTFTTSYYSDDKLAQGNAMLADICEHYGVTYVDLRYCGISTADLPDGIHPDATGMDYITNAVLEALLACNEVSAGKNVVYSITHELENTESSLSYYKGISEGRSFTETLSGENLSVVVTMGGEDITDSCYKNGVISIENVTGDIVIKAKAAFSLGDHLQELPNPYYGMNLWSELEHDDEYFYIDEWTVHSSGNVYSVTVPVIPGEKIYASSFEAAGVNGGFMNGIRITFFSNEGVLTSMGPADVYEEFAENGYVIVPEGATAVNIPMWTNASNWEMYIWENSYEPSFDLGNHLQQLPEKICPCVNLWLLLEPQNDYYTSTGWGNLTTNQVWSVTIPVVTGDKIYANSFKKNSENGNNYNSMNGIRVTWFGENGVLKTMTADQTYAEYATNGYLIAPEGATAVNIPMWTNSDKNELYILNLEHKYDSAVTEPTCVDKGYTTHTCSVCGDSYVDSPVEATGHSYGEWIVVEEATCTEAGDERRDCKNCEHFETKEVEVLGHDYEAVVTAPTCTDAGHTTHICTRCDDSYTDTPVAASGHSMSAWTVTTAATCTTAGSQKRACANCDYFETDELPALGHTASEAWTFEKLANCTETGSKYHACTNGCGTKLDVTVISAIGHSMGAWTTVKEATCTEAGSKRRDCNACDYYEVNTLQKLGHSYEAVVIVPTCTENGYTSFDCENCGDSYVDNYTDELGHSYVSVVTEPTCVDKGYITHTCSVCGDSYIDSQVEATGHSYGEWIVVEGAACTEAGDERRDCKNCEHFETKEVEALGHDYETEVTDPTCTVDGYTTHTCIRCDDSYTDTPVAASGHNMSAWTVTTAATCTTAGSQKRACANCDYFETDGLPALGHAASEAWTFEKLANCTETGSKYHACTNGCGTKLDVTVISAIGHSMGAWTMVKEATCTEAGSKRRDCNACDHYEVNTLQKLGHSYEAVVIVPTCTENGYTAFDCENCGDSYVDNYTDELGHSYVSVVTEPTCTEKGYTSYLCLKCQHSYVDNYTDPAHTPVVDKAVEPTCTKTGLAEGSHCEVCNEVLVSQKVVPVAEHNYGDWYETVIPVCGQTGMHRRDCADCEAFETEEITCGHEVTYPWDVDGDDVLEILAIGNSFSVDSLEYAYQIAESLGIKEVVIGNLYYSGGSLKIHYSNAANDSAAYKYYYNDNGTWETTDNYKISTALTDRSWDYISLQQESGDSGTESTYNSDLTNLISYIRTIISPESNPNRNQCAKIVWHMTWTYQKDSANTNFAKYDNDQMTMYNSIVSAVENKIVTNQDISVVIPVGTAIQNARTSFIGDTLTRDGEHLTTVYGRYVAGLTFIKSITGLTLTEEVFAPYGVSDEYKTIALESANNAYQKPFEVTDSMYPPHVHDYDFVVTPPTCVKKGYTTYSCEGCGHSYVDDYVDATGNHSYKAGVCTICEKSVLTNGWITPKFAKGDYTMAVIPDPQICVARKPESYYKMTNWIVNNKDPYNIKAVLHVGDMVDNNHDAEWIVTKKGMDMINDVGIPWMPMRGNHDNSDYFNNYFDYTTYGTNQSWFGGSYEEGKLDQTYWFVTVKDREYMILSLGWAPDWDVLDWAAGIVEKYPEKSVIIVAHAYMYRDGTLLSKDDKYSVNYYPGYDGYPEGEDIWAKFKKYENVVLAMGGHIGSSNVATYTDKNGAGKNVTSLLADNQDNAKKDPLGMLLLLTFHEDSDVVDINWYSAEYDALYRTQNQFSITVPHVCEHQYESEIIKPTCTKEGYTLHICSLCDNSYTDTPTKALGHTWDAGVITTKPTALAPGVKTYTCSVCQSTKTEEVAFEGYDVKRIWGSSRYNTSLAIADELKAELGIERFETVIIASGENFPDALAGSYLAAEKDAPILMTDGKSNLESLYQYIDENVNSKGQIYILGGTGAVPDNVFDALKGKGYKVERLKGTGRYETNIEILKEAGTNGKEILVCTGTDFADSLSASAADLPILLVDGKGKLSDAQKEYLSTIKGSKFCIVGGSGVVSTSIENELTVYGTVERVYGKGRYETSIAFAERYFDNPDTAVVAYAWNFPDGLCGGPLAAKSNAPLILTGADKTDGKKPTTEQEEAAAGAAAAYIKTYKIESGIVLGGTGVLSDDTVNVVFDLK